MIKGFRHNIIGRTRPRLLSRWISVGNLKYYYDPWHRLVRRFVAAGTIFSISLACAEKRLYTPIFIEGDPVAEAHRDFVGGAWH